MPINLLKRNSNLYQTIRVIKKVIKRKSKNLKNILDRINQDENIEKQLFEIANKIPFKADPEGLQLVKTADRTLRDNEANCVDYSILIAQALEYFGIPYRLIIADYGNGYEHIYPQTLNGITLDAVSKEFDYEKKPKRKFSVMPDLYLLNGLPNSNNRWNKKNALNANWRQRLFNSDYKKARKECFTLFPNEGNKRRACISKVQTDWTPENPYKPITSDFDYIQTKGDRRRGNKTPRTRGGGNGGGNGGGGFSLSPTMMLPIAAVAVFLILKK